MKLTQKTIKICFEDLETGYILAHVPENLNNAQIIWLIQYMHNVLTEEGVYEDKEPSVELLCQHLNSIFHTFQFLPLLPDLEWCDNSPKLTCVPPVLFEEQLSILNILQKFYPEQLMRYTIHPTYISNQETKERYSLQDGLSTFYMKIKNKNLDEILLSHQKHLFYNLLKNFNITISENR